MVSLDLGSVFATASDVRLLATEEVPEDNQFRVFLDEAITSPELSRWIPTSNVVLRVSGTYRDGADRSLS